MLWTCGASVPPIPTTTSGGPPMWLRCSTPSLGGTDSMFQARGPRDRKRCTDDHVTACSGCRTGPGKSGRWLIMKNAQRTLTEYGRPSGQATVGDVDRLLEEGHQVTGVDNLGAALPTSSRPTGTTAPAAAVAGFRRDGTARRSTGYDILILDA